eukprot:sb/3462492/
MGVTGSFRGLANRKREIQTIPTIHGVRLGCTVIVLQISFVANIGCFCCEGVCEKECLSNQYADNLKPFPGLPTHEPENTDPEKRVKVCVACDELCSSCRGPGTESYQCLSLSLSLSLSLFLSLSLSLSLSLTVLYSLYKKGAHSYSVCVACDELCSSCRGPGTESYQCTCKYAQDGERCVRECPPGKWKSLLDKKCIPCNGPCPNNCHSNESVPVTRSTLLEFSNCNLVEGSVIIDYTSWTGSDPISVPELEAMNEIETITGRLVIRDSPDPTFTNMGMLKRLKSVNMGNTRQKRDTTSNGYAVDVSNNTALATAELIGLADVDGRVKIAGDNLCYADTVNWDERIGPGQVEVAAGGSDCGVCHVECAGERGCLGPGDDMCDKCRNKEFQTRCVPTCEGASYDDGTKLCKACHENCQTCTGPGNQHCIACKYVIDEGACVQECTNPSSTFEDPLTQECTPCDKSCEKGCTGPGNNLACNVCTFSCPSRSYMITTKQKNREGKQVYVEECLPCHEECTRCSHSSSFNCDQCANVRQGKECKAVCDDGFYADPDKNCQPCHPNCRTCLGGGEGNCTLCNKYEIFPTGVDEEELVTSQTRSCVDECPRDYTHQIIGKSGGKEYVKCVMSCEEVRANGDIYREKESCEPIPGRSAKGTNSKKLIFYPNHVTKIQTKRSNAKIRTNLGLSLILVHVGILADTCTKSGIPTPKSQNHVKGDFRPFLAFFN